MSNMNFVWFAIAVALTFFFSSCENLDEKEIPEPVEIEVADTIEVLLEPTFLPDTSYMSAQQLYYQIDTFLAIDAQLATLKDAYDSAPGIFTFRGDISRNPNFVGHIHGDSVKMKVDWVFETAYDASPTNYDVWGGGCGWTGQPLYVEWPDSLVERFRQESDSLMPSFSNREVIVASLCRKIYFINFETGEKTRKTIDAGNVVKGTPGLDPSMNGLLFVGQGVPYKGQFGNLTIDLFKHKRVDFFPKDPHAWRSWGAYDPSPSVVGGFLFRLGENGTVYKYYYNGEKYELHSTLRYSTSKAKSSPGMESSLATYLNYGYFSDNKGNVLCINLNNLRPVWHYFNHDDSDASVLVDVEAGCPYVYSGCEVDRQGMSGISYFVKLNGLTGERVWEVQVPCNRISFVSKVLDGGMFSSPLLGLGDCEGMIFTNFCVNKSEMKGCLAAIDKNDGRVIYKTKLKQYAWSSPVPFLNDNNEMFIFTGDTNGRVYMIKGATGEIILCEKLGKNFEGSPIAVGNSVIIGSRGNNIYKVSFE